ncbi:MAG: hypothetical protein EOO90_00865 [Pedobacter sp.]|nr:MAG: hypothetical protein EOO90_00865 [Pedobacter sp.]
MMRANFLFLFLLIIILPKIGYGCICSFLSTTSVEYQRSAFVATVKIVKNYKNIPDTNEYYKADIEIIDLYKGKKISSIYILGGEVYNSCGTFIPEGETRLIFGTVYKEKYISTFLCGSYKKPLEAYYKRDQIGDKLRLLKKHASKHMVNINNEVLLYPVNFNRIYNPDSVNYFSLVKVELNRDRSVKAIRYLTKDSQKLKKAYEYYFKNQFDWRRIERIKSNQADGITLFFEINPYTNSNLSPMG